MKISAYGNQVMIEPEKVKQVLVSDSHSLCEYGTVVSVGEDVKTIKVGDKIGYLIWGLNSLEMDGTKYYFVPESSEFILCKIDE